MGGGDTHGDHTNNSDFFIPESTDSAYRTSTIDVIYMDEDDFVKKFANFYYICKSAQPSAKSSEFQELITTLICNTC